jgi:hypothetical protein
LNLEMATAFGYDLNVDRQGGRFSTTTNKEWKQGSDSLFTEVSIYQSIQKRCAGTAQLFLTHIFVNDEYSGKILFFFLQQMCLARCF